ncbi:hypothetical protein ACM25N_02965 [Roseovarius sp. C7]|uniref:hypothetical protein n=1 Tax=Roseovarius sp. C7 TaxID=3398643 RepID=UPI0039F58D78
MTGAARYFMGPLVAAGLWLSPVCAGESDLADLTATERAVLGAEIREVLRTLPRDMLPDAPAPRVDPYAQAVRDDLALIASHAATLFGIDAAEQSIAFLTREDCADCAKSLAELEILAEKTGWHIRVIDLDHEAALGTALGLDTVPSYVLPNMMLRGAMPAVVLEKYLSR